MSHPTHASGWSLGGIPELWTGSSWMFVSQIGFGSPSHLCFLICSPRNVMQSYSALHWHHLFCTAYIATVGLVNPRKVFLPANDYFHVWILEPQPWWLEVGCLRLSLCWRWIVEWRFAKAKEVQMDMLPILQPCLSARRAATLLTSKSTMC